MTLQITLTWIRFLHFFRYLLTSQGILICQTKIYIVERINLLLRLAWHDQIWVGPYIDLTLVKHVMNGLGEEKEAVTTKVEFLQLATSCDSCRKCDKLVGSCRKLLQIPQPSYARWDSFKGQLIMVCADLLQAF